MAWIAALATLGGAAASAYGASETARKANNAASDARYANAAEVARQRENLGSSIFGANNWAQYMNPEGQYLPGAQQTYVTDKDGNKTPYQNYFTPAQLAARQGFTDMLGGPLYDQVKGINSEAAAGANKIPGMYDAETTKLMGSAGNYTNQLRGMYSSGSNAILGAYDKGASGLMRMQDSFGQARDKTIRRDAARELTNRNDATRATLAASGFGNSTALPASMNANAQAVSEGRDKALTDLVGQKTALGRGMLSERAGMTKDLFGQSASALERSMSAEQALGQERSNTSVNLAQANLAQQLQYKSNPLNFAYSALTGGGLSPYGDQSGSLPLPSYSPTGVGMSTAGNATAGMGSMLLLQQLMGKQGGGSSYGNWGGQMSQMQTANGG